MCLYNMYIKFSLVSQLVEIMRRGLSSILFRCQLDQLGVECPKCRLVGG